jgi:hypothetical protein
VFFNVIFIHFNSVGTQERNSLSNLADFKGMILCQQVGTVYLTQQKVAPFTNRLLQKGFLTNHRVMGPLQSNSLFGWDLRSAKNRIPGQRSPFKGDLFA